MRGERFGIRDSTIEDVDGYQLTFLNRLQGDA